jgi:hypothetical protein
MPRAAHEPDVFRRFWCRFLDCQASFELIAGRLPAECPVCFRPAMWSSMEGNLLKPPQRRPRVPWTLSYNDRQMLKRLSIAQV